MVNITYMGICFLYNGRQSTCRGKTQYLKVSQRYPQPGHSFLPCHRSLCFIQEKRRKGLFICRKIMATSFPKHVSNILLKTLNKTYFLSLIVVSLDSSKRHIQIVKERDIVLNNRYVEYNG